MTRVRSYGKQGADIKSATAPKNRAIHGKLVDSATWHERALNCISDNLSESRTDFDNPKVLRPLRVHASHQGVIGSFCRIGLYQ